MASQSSSSSLPGPHSSHFIKLSDTKYLLWLRQIKPFLIGRGLWKYVDGSFSTFSLSAPTRTLS
ncbi:hypothetical protein GBA52_024463 [Prunus armeniaca]|nr:hypothetical protein GBA52_024463 [Prunus armeniaca]